MIDARSYFIQESNIELPNIQGTQLADSVENLLTSDTLQAALVNSSFDEWLPSDALPARAVHWATILFADAESVEAEVRRWNQDTPFTDEYKEEEVTKYLRAREIAIAAVEDPRTIWSMKEGMFMLPLEVVQDVQAEWYDSIHPLLASTDSVNDRQTAQRARQATAIGLTAAATQVGLMSGDQLLARQSIERSVVVGLIASVGLEVAELPSAFYDIKPIEHITGAHDLFTGQWFHCLSDLSDNYSWSDKTTPVDTEIRALEEVVAELVYALRLDYQLAEEAGLDPMVALSAELTYAHHFLADLINARWEVLPLGSGNYDNEPAAEKSPNQEEALAPEDGIDYIVTLLRGGGMLPEGLTTELILDSMLGRRSFRGTSRPEQLLRQALYDARHSHIDPKERKTALMLFQSIYDQVTRRPENEV